jgi:2-dehydropantoate 2-reductase
MRILVVGAGALGGYFGGCLLKAGRDVTFLVRPERASQLARDGLRVVSPHGDFGLPVRTVVADSLDEPFDLILLAVKSYSLDAVMEQFAPAVGPATAILPVLNGMAHIDSLCRRFAADRVLGGMAQISATLDADGRVALLFAHAELVFGELGGGVSERTSAILAELSVAGFQARVSDAIEQDMWEKWMIVGTVAGITCLMRASIGDIIASPGGQGAILRLFAEAGAVGAAAGFAPRPKFTAEETVWLTEVGSPLKASMLRGIERGAPTEGDHMLGEMVARARTFGVETPLLDLARCHVAAYDAARAREVAEHNTGTTPIDAA